MSLVDYIVLGGYLLGTLVVGLYFSRRNKTASDMFSAGGGSPWWVAGLSSFMTMFSAGTFVIWGGIAYKYGLVAVSINMTYGVAALAAGYFVAGRWNEIGVKTAAEYVELRFGKSALQLYTWTLIIFRLVTTAVALYALSVLVAATMPLADPSIFRDASTGNVSVTILIILFGLVAVCYTMIGGLWAVLMTDVIQFIILNLSVIFIVALTFLKIDDMGDLLASAPDGFFSITSAGYTFYFLAGWCATQFFMIGAEWAFVQRSLSVSSPNDARKANYLFGFLYLFSPILWLAPPLLFRLSHPGVDPEQAYILAGQWVLPLGAMGLLIAAMFSATASMMSSQLNVFAGVLTNDFYRKIFRPYAEERHLVFVGRLFTGGIGIILVIIAILVPKMGGAERVVISLSSLIVGPLMAPTIWGLLTKRIDIRAIWATAGISAGIGVFFKFGLGTLAGGCDFDVLQILWDWSQENPQTLDIVLGVVVPVTVLCVAHYLTRVPSSGWQRIEKLRAAHVLVEKGESDFAQSDSTPGKVVAIALAVCGGTMFLLVPFNPTGKASLAVFGLSLVLIGFAFYRRSRVRFAR